jgi:hypothetical protein
MFIFKEHVSSSSVRERHDVMRSRAISFSELSAQGGQPFLGLQLIFCLPSLPRWCSNKSRAACLQRRFLFQCIVASLTAIYETPSCRGITMPPLPSIATPALLSSIRKHPQLPHHTWYFIAATALSVLNRPDEIPVVYEHALYHGASAPDSKPAHEEQLKISRRMREALIKAAAIGGLPKVTRSHSDSFSTS